MLKLSKVGMSQSHSFEMKDPFSTFFFSCPDSIKISVSRVVKRQVSGRGNLCPN